MRRTYGRSDPIAAARGHIQRKLKDLQQEIVRNGSMQLLRCDGPQKRLLRLTMDQLMMTEPTIEGKIQRLMNIADLLLHANVQDEWQAETASQLRHEEHERKDQMAKYQYFDEIERQGRRDSPNAQQSSLPVNQSTQYSPKLSRSPQHRTATQNSQVQDRQISMHPSCENSSISHFSHLIHSEHSPVRVKDSIKDQHIFSFRTQPVSHLNRQSYDGVSIAYSPQNAQERQSIKEKTAQKEIVRKQQLMEKIRKRIKLSTCVVGAIEHTNSCAAVAGLMKRVELQRGIRRTLIGEIEGAGWK